MLEDLSLNLSFDRKLYDSIGGHGNSGPRSEEAEQHWRSVVRMGFGPVCSEMGG